MAEAVFAIPGDLATPTGGYGYDRRVMALLPASGVAVHHCALPASFPFPASADLAETERRLRTAPRSAVLVVDGLAYGAIPASLVRDLDRPVVALVHHPLGLEAGLPRDAAQMLIASETAALAEAAAVIVTSPATAETLVTQFAVRQDRVSIAEPGTDPAPRAPADGDPVRILCVGTISPRKAQRLLVEALAEIADRRWTLTLIGADDRYPDEVDCLKRSMAEAGIADRVHIAGALPEDAVAAAYREADLFVLPSLYEGFGMVVTEAMARGLPIVATTGAVALDTLPADSSLRVPPGDVPALREALRGLLDDPDRRRRLADEAWAAAAGLPRWERTADIVASVITRVGA